VDARRRSKPQKPREGRWCSTSAPTAAVASGISPVMTEACIASTRRTARPSNSGQPSTLPAADSASIGQCCRRGHGAREISR
jgi:hypothetical protein